MKKQSKEKKWTCENQDSEKFVKHIMKQKKKEIALFACVVLTSYFEAMVKFEQLRRKNIELHKKVNKK